MLKQKKIAVIITCLVSTFLLASLIGCRSNTVSTNGSDSSSSAGTSAPSFSITLTDGKKISLEGFKGKAVVINFWATWCPYCIDEAPALEKAYQKYKKEGLEMIAIAAESSPEKEVLSFIEKYKITYRVGIDEGNEIINSYDVQSFPTTVFITQDGKINNQRVGAITEEDLTKEIEEIIK